MSTRMSLLAVAMGAAVAMASCSTVAPDSSPGPTLAPLGSQSPPPGEPADPDADADADGVVEPTGPTTTASATSTTVSRTSTTAATTSTTAATTSTTSSSTTTTTPSTTAASPSGGLVDGVSADIAGRTLSFASACRDGRAVTLDGVTWAFAGNSFRLTGDDDARTEAELVGDGWTMPMVVAAVQSGVYRYVGTPVDGSVGSAVVIVDHTTLSTC